MFVVLLVSLHLLLVLLRLGDYYSCCPDRHYVIVAFMAT